MNTYITADPHFGHVGILHHADRPWKTVEEMDEALISNWNAEVHKQDQVIIVGDFAWKNHIAYLDRLNGRKILVRGNHDDFSKKVESKFSEVHDLLERKFEGQRIVMCHYPMRGWRGAANGSWHLYGHHHGTAQEDPGSCCFDIGVDVWFYRPVSLEVVAAKMKQKLEYRAAHPYPFSRAEMMLRAQTNRLSNKEVMAGMSNFNAAAFWEERRQAKAKATRVEED